MRITDKSFFMTHFSCSFYPEAPGNCPPSEAWQGDQSVFRCVDNNQAVLDDFVSDVKANRRLADPSNCNSWGCSVWVNEDAVDHAMKIFRSFRKKFIVKGDVNTGDGAMLHTPSPPQPDHHTFWQAEDVDVSSKFAVFIAKGEKV